MYYGMKVSIVNAVGGVCIFRNVTEVHYGYDDHNQRIAIESDIHSTGFSADRKNMVEMEITPEEEQAEKFEYPPTNHCIFP